MLRTDLALVALPLEEALARATCLKGRATDAASAGRPTAEINCACSIAVREAACEILGLVACTTVLSRIVFDRTDVASGAVPSVQAIADAFTIDDVRI